MLSLCLFGAPDFSGFKDEETSQLGFGKEIAPLPGAEIEVLGISDLVSSEGIISQVFIGKEATEQRLKELKGFDVLHLATHGFFNNNAYRNNPMLSYGLLLSKDISGRSDGVLTAYEASLLNLEKTKMVVLSACKTGMGKVREGEGVYGLQRAFEVAGVNNVIMSFWNIDDTITQELMIIFYQKLLEGKDVMKAFNNAQLELKEKRPNPYYWGAFKLIKSYDKYQ